MEIFLTNKLSELIQPNKVISDQKSNVKWSAHLFILKRKKNIIITHKETLYSFFVVGVSKNELQYLPDRIINELKVQLGADEIDLKLASAYFEILKNTAIDFLKTDNDKKTLGWINDTIQTNQYMFDHYNSDPIISSAYFAHNSMNQRLVGSRKYKSPIKMLQEKLV